MKALRQIGSLAFVLGLFVEKGSVRLTHYFS